MPESDDGFFRFSAGMLVGFMIGCLASKWFFTDVLPWVADLCGG